MALASSTAVGSAALLLQGHTRFKPPSAIAPMDVDAPRVPRSAAMSKQAPAAPVSTQRPAGRLQRFDPVHAQEAPAAKAAAASAVLDAFEVAYDNPRLDMAQYADALISTIRTRPIVDPRLLCRPLLTAGNVEFLSRLVMIGRGTFSVVMRSDRSSDVQPNYVYKISMHDAIDVSILTKETLQEAAIGLLVAASNDRTLNAALVPTQLLRFWKPSQEEAAVFEKWAASVASKAGVDKSALFVGPAIRQELALRPGGGRLEQNLPLVDIVDILPEKVKRKYIRGALEKEVVVDYIGEYAAFQLNQYATNRPPRFQGYSIQRQVYAGSTTLSSLLKSGTTRDEASLRGFMRILFVTLAELFKKFKFVHMDLSPENIMAVRRDARQSDPRYNDTAGLHEYLPVLIDIGRCSLDTKLVEGGPAIKQLKELIQKQKHEFAPCGSEDVRRLGFQFAHRCLAAVRYVLDTSLVPLSLPAVGAAIKQVLSPLFVLMALRMCSVHPVWESVPTTADAEQYLRRKRDTSDPIKMVALHAISVTRYLRDIFYAVAIDDEEMLYLTLGHDPVFLYSEANEEATRSATWMLDRINVYWPYVTSKFPEVAQKEADFTPIAVSENWNKVWTWRPGTKLA